MVGALLRLNFFGDRRRYHIDFWKPDPPSPLSRNDLSLPVSAHRNPRKILLVRHPPFLSPSLVLPRPKALRNTDQLSSNCVSRLARSLGPSATVIPLQAFGPEPFVYTRARARARTYVHARDVARNPGIPCRGDVATGSARSDASNTPLR